MIEEIEEISYTHTPDENDHFNIPILMEKRGRRGVRREDLWSLAFVLYSMTE